MLRPVAHAYAHAAQEYRASEETNNGLVYLSPFDRTQSTNQQITTLLLDYGPAEPYHTLMRC